MIQPLNISCHACDYYCFKALYGICRTPKNKPAARCGPAQGCSFCFAYALSREKFYLNEEFLHDSTSETYPTHKCAEIWVFQGAVGKPCTI
jgi:hypothetical protein